MNDSEVQSGERKKPTVDWDDPAVPPGNSPPLPAWPLWLAVAMWGAWEIFLVITAVLS